MVRQILSVFSALLLTAGCTARGAAYSGQQLLVMPAGGLRFWSLSQLEQALGGQFETLTLTALPNQGRCALYLDGKPLRAGQTLTQEQAGRVAMFTVKNSGPVTVGVFSTPILPEKEIFRIRCINPHF